MERIDGHAVWVTAPHRSGDTAAVGEDRDRARTRARMAFPVCAALALWAVIAGVVYAICLL